MAKESNLGYIISALKECRSRVVDLLIVFEDADVEYRAVWLPAMERSCVKMKELVAQLFEMKEYKKFVKWLCIYEDLYASYEHECNRFDVDIQEFYNQKGVKVYEL